MCGKKIEVMGDYDLQHVVNVVQIIVMKCLRKFKFHTKLDYDDIKFKGEVTLRLSGQHLLHVEDRNPP